MSSRKDDAQQSVHLSVQEWSSLRDRVAKAHLPEVLARVVDIALHGKDKEALAASNTVIGWFVGNVADETRKNTRASITLMFSQVQQVDGELVDAKDVDVLDVTPSPPPVLDAARMAEIATTLDSLAGSAESGAQRSDCNCDA